MDMIDVLTAQADAKRKYGPGGTGLPTHLSEAAIAATILDEVAAPIAAAVAPKLDSTLAATTYAGARTARTSAALAHRKPNSVATATESGITTTIQTAATTAETDITSAVSWAAQTYCRFTLCGAGAPVVVAGIGYKGPRARAAAGGDAWADDAVDVMVHEPDGTIELMLQIIQSGYQTLRLYADDRLILDWNAAYAVDQRYRVKLVFDANRSKSVHLRWVGTMGAAQVRTGQHGSAWKPTKPIYRAKVISIGDSFMLGAQDPTYSAPKGGYFRRLVEQFQLDGRRVAYSSTGLTADGGVAGRTNYLDRVAEAKTVNGDCDFGLLQLSTNDGGQTQAAISTAMTTWVANWKAQFPGRPVMVIGVARGIPTGPSTINCDAIDNGAISVMNANLDVFPMPLISTAGWWTGDGYDTHAATTTPKGTTEIGIASDGLHPRNAGHDLMAERLRDPLSTFLSIINLA